MALRRTAVQGIDRGVTVAANDIELSIARNEPVESWDHQRVDVGVSQLATSDPQPGGQLVEGNEGRHGAIGAEDEELEGWLGGHNAAAVGEVRWME